MFEMFVHTRETIMGLSMCSFFDVVNKTNATIFVTGLTAGSRGSNVEAMLYACRLGASSGHETEEEA